MARIFVCRVPVSRTRGSTYTHVYRKEESYSLVASAQTHSRARASRRPTRVLHLQKREYMCAIHPLECVPIYIYISCLQAVILFTGARARMEIQLSDKCQVGCAQTQRGRGSTLDIVPIVLPPLLHFRVKIEVHTNARRRVRVIAAGGIWLSCKRAKRGRDYWQV